MSLKARITLYSLTLSFGVFNIVFGAVDGAIGFDHTDDSFSPYLRYFSPIAGFFGLLTAIWASVLLAFNNRPKSNHALTRASVHFASMATLAIIWLALMILVATQLPKECDFVTPSDGLAVTWCGLAATVVAVSALLAITSVLIFQVCRQTGTTSSGNIAHLGGQQGQASLLS